MSKGNMRSVAIVGFSEKTFPYCMYSKADEVWSLNYAFLVNDQMPRFDRLFEIHKRDWYLRKEVITSQKYDEWLKNNHTIPVIMQESELTPDIPMGVRFPYEEICEKFLKKLVKVDYETGEENYQQYFTSSFAFMMALALYEGFDEIEIFGIDMEINTEYSYQKPNGEFWVGIALGMGKTVKFPKQSYMCSALVYGYDVIPYIDPPRVKEIVEIYQDKMHAYFREGMEIAKQYAGDPENKELQDKWLEVTSWGNAYQGAVSAASKLLLESDTYISRQFVEIKRDSYINGMDYWKARYNQLRSQSDVLLEQGTPDGKLWEEALNARANMFAHMGALQLHKQLIHIMDLRPVNFELVMEIMEAEEAKKKGRIRFMGDDLENK